MKCKTRCEGSTHRFPKTGNKVIVAGAGYGTTIKVIFDMDDGRSETHIVESPPTLPDKNMTWDINQFEEGMRVIKLNTGDEKAVIPTGSEGTVTEIYGSIVYVTFDNEPTLRCSYSYENPFITPLITQKKLEKVYVKEYTKCEGCKEPFTYPVTYTHCYKCR